MYLNQENTGYKRRVKVLNVSLWTPLHDISRVYVFTYPKTNTYFDIYRKEWTSDMENIDMDKLISDVFLMNGVTNEKELENSLRK